MEYNYEKMRNRTYGFDLTPLIFLAWSTGDKEWLKTLHKRYMKDVSHFPSFYSKRIKKINYLE